MVAYVNPAIAVAAGVAILGEPFTAGTAIGFALIIGGSWLATGPGRTRVPADDAAGAAREYRPKAA